MVLEFKRYLLVGVGSNLINFFIYQFLNYMGIQLFVAALLGYLAGLSISYTYSRLWVFGQKFISSRKLILSFSMVYVLGGLGMSLLIVASVNIFGFDYRIAWISGSIFAVMNNFCGQKFFVFKKGIING